MSVTRGTVRRACLAFGLVAGLAGAAAAQASTAAIPGSPPNLTFADGVHLLNKERGQLNTDSSSPVVTQKNLQ